MAKPSRIRMPSPRRWFRLPLPSSVRGQIIAGFSLLVLIIAVGAAGSIWLTREHRSDMAEMREHIATTSLLQDTKVFGALALTELQRYLASGDQAAASETRAYLATAADSLAEARAQEETRDNAEEVANLDEITVGTAFFSETAEQVITLRQSGDVEGAAAALEAATPQLQRSGLEIDQAAEFEQQEVAALQARANRTGDLALWFAVIVAGIAAALALAATLFINRSILKPLSSLESAALAVAGGDLEARATASGPRELVHLGETLNRMTESLLDASKRRELEAERERAYAQLRESEERLRILFESAPDAYFLSDLQGNLVDVNRAAQEITGLSKEESVGKNYADLDLLPPEDLPKAAAILAKGIAGEPAGPTELTFNRSNGGSVVVELRMFPVQIRGQALILATARDISERKRAEEALRESDERHRALVESAFEGIAISRAGKILDANESFARMFGYELPEVIGLSPLEMTTPESAELILNNVQSGFEKSYEITGIKKDGATFNIEVIGRNCVFQGREARITAFRDITEIKRAEAALRLSEERYRELVENANDIIYSHDLSGTFTSMNGACERIMGYTPAEVLQMNIVQVVAPDHLEYARQMIGRKVEDGGRTTYRLEIIAKDGHRVPLEVSTRLIFRGGKPVGVQGIARDISERKQAEEALRLSEERLKILFESAPDGYYLMDLQGTFLDGNKASEEITGYKREELIGKKFHEAGLLSPDELPKAVAALAKNIAGQTVAPLELTLNRKDGARMPVEISTFPVEIDGQPVILGIARDITERKRAEEEARLLLSVTQAIDGAEDFHTAIEVALRKVCEATSWEFAESWIPCPDGTALECGPVWGREAETLAKFTLSSERFTFPPGSGLPGRVWLSNQPEWIKDVSTEPEQIFPRVKVALEAGLKAALGVPITASGEVLAVMLFFMLEPRAEDQRAVELVSAVAQQLGSVVQRKRAEEALRESEGRFRDLYENAPNAYFSVGMDGRLRRSNRRAEELLGYTAEELVGRPVLELYPDTPQGKEKALELLQRFQAGQPIRNEELLIQRADGTPVWISLTVNGITDASGEIVESRSVVVDITERKRAEEEQQRLDEELETEHREIDKLNRSLERRVKERTETLRLAYEELQDRNRELLDARAQATTDGLTGLRNHRTFQEKVREMVARAQADGGNVGLIMLDIDGFKQVNDSLGHQAGDEILLLLAQTLTNVVPWQDAYRYGGDEFAVLLPGTDGTMATRIAERLRRAVAKRTDGNGAKVTVSLGIADFPHTAESAEQLIYGADAAMYWAKSAGKNRVGDWSKLLKGRTDGTLPWYAADRGVRAPDVVAALVAALAAKDPVTAAHTERCSWYTAKLAEELGLGEEEASIVRLASLLHDIGKLAVPDEVLFKPGPLNEDEWTLMKQHPTSALHVLDQIHSIADATPAILHHHEHFDGSGYPDGLAGDDIPLASRILLVTDAFDAMTTDRPYRKALPVETATEELKRNSGSQFDPAIVEAFLRILARDGAQPLRSGTAPAEPALAGSSGEGKERR